MRKYIFVLLFVSGYLCAQQQNKFSFELQGNTFFGIGNNFIADGPKPFTGFGFGLSGKLYNNLGLSIEFHRGFSDVKDVSVFGDLHSPTLTSLDIVAFYRYQATEKFELEGNIGAGSIQINSKSNYRSNGFQEGGTALIIGAKGIYSITKNNSLYVLGGPRLYFLSTLTEMDNAAADQYYSKATLFNFSLGLRLYF